MASASAREREAIRGALPCRGLWIASAASRPRNDGYSFSVMASASASEREAIQNRAGRYGPRLAQDSRRRPPGLLRPLRGLAMTAGIAAPSPGAPCGSWGYAGGGREAAAGLGLKHELHSFIHHK